MTRRGNSNQAMKNLETVKEIYIRQADRVYRTALVLLQNHADAEDVLQSVFLTVIEKDVSFRDREHEKAWFLVTTRNRCKDKQKNYWRQKVDLKDETSAFSMAVEDDHDTMEMLELISALPEPQRTLILLHYYEGYTVAEAAELLGIRESKARSGLVSARRKLRGKLEQQG